MSVFLSLDDYVSKQSKSIGGKISDWWKDDIMGGSTDNRRVIERNRANIKRLLADAPRRKSFDGTRTAYSPELLEKIQGIYQNSPRRNRLPVKDSFKASESALGRFENIYNGDGPTSIYDAQINDLEVKTAMRKNKAEMDSQRSTNSILDRLATTGGLSSGQRERAVRDLENRNLFNKQQISADSYNQKLALKSQDENRKFGLLDKITQYRTNRDLMLDQARMQNDEGNRRDFSDKLQSYQLLTQAKGHNKRLAAEDIRAENKDAYEKWLQKMRAYGAMETASQI